MPSPKAQSDGPASPCSGQFSHNVEEAVRRARACLRRAERLFTDACREDGNLLSENEDEFSLGSEMLKVANPGAAEKAIRLPAVRPPAGKGR